jgi:PAS domain S-box-containing protein
MALRDRIAHQLLAIVVPVVAVTTVILLLALPLVDPTHPTRMIPLAVVDVFLFGAWILDRGGRSYRGASVFFIGLIATVAVAMYLHGGLHAPGALLPVVAMVSIASLNGGGRTAIAWGVFAVLGLLFAVAEKTGHLGTPPPFEPILMWLLITVFSGLAAVFTLIPVRQMVRALHDLEAQAGELERARLAERHRLLQFEAAFDQSFQMMGLLDPAGIMLKTNATSLRFIGVEAAAVIGKPFPETPWFQAGQRAQVAAAIRRAAAGERVAYRVNITDNAGAERIIDFSLSPFRDAHGNVVYLIPEGRDITAITAAEAHLQQAMKMDSLGQLAGGVAHDFNNMLTGIGMAVDLLDAELVRTQASGAAREHVHVLRQATERAAELTRHLMLFARKTPLEHVQVDVNAVARAALALLERSIDRRILITVNEAEDPALILGNAGQLEHALINLGLNARDAITGYGTIAITVNRLDVTPGNERHGEVILPHGAHVAVAVRDSGCGMDETVRRRLFEPFFTTKGAGKGTGLGLASVYGTIGDHGGAIGVESLPGHGSCFTLYLPRLVSVAPAITPATPTPLGVRKLPAQGGSGRILLVDDEPSLRQMAAEVLEMLGYAVVTAVNGRDALDRFRADQGAFDLLIVDMSMPGMSGGELCQILRQGGATVPIIVATGYANQDGGAHLQGLADLRVMQKPFRINLLGQTIAEMLSTTGAQSAQTPVAAL